MNTPINFFSKLDTETGSLNDLCECVELEWSPIPNPACPIHGGDNE